MSEQSKGEDEGQGGEHGEVEWGREGKCSGGKVCCGNSHHSQRAYCILGIGPGTLYSSPESQSY